MESTLKKDTVAEAFLDVELLIHSTVNAFQEMYGGNTDDLFGEATLHFLKAYTSYNPKYSFSTWVRFKVWKGLLESKINECRRIASIRRRYDQFKDRFKYRSKEAHMEPVDPSTNPIQNILEAISSDAKTVVRLVLTTPMNIKTKKSLWNYLNGIGWSANRIAASFTEITNALYS